MIVAMKARVDRATVAVICLGLPAAAALIMAYFENPSDALSNSLAELISVGVFAAGVPYVVLEARRHSIRRRVKEILEDTTTLIEQAHDSFLIMSGSPVLDRIRLNRENLCALVPDSFPADRLDALIEAQKIKLSMQADLDLSLMCVNLLSDMWSECDPADMAKKAVKFSFPKWVAPLGVVVACIAGIPIVVSAFDGVRRHLEFAISTLHNLLVGVAFAFAGLGASVIWTSWRRRSERSEVGRLADSVSEFVCALQQAFLEGGHGRTAADDVERWGRRVSARLKDLERATGDTVLDHLSREAVQVCADYRQSIYREAQVAEEHPELLNSWLNLVVEQETGITANIARLFDIIDSIDTRLNAQYGTPSCSVNWMQPTGIKAYTWDIGYQPPIVKMLKPMVPEIEWRDPGPVVDY